MVVVSDLSQPFLGSANSSEDMHELALASKSTGCLSYENLISLRNDECCKSRGGLEERGGER